MWFLIKKFNSILEECLQDGLAENHYIMSIVVNLNEFDMTGCLTSTSKVDFWQEVNKALTRFDAGDISLKPRKFQGAVVKAASAAQVVKSSVKAITKQEREQHMGKRKLPTPPLAKKVQHSRKSRSRSRSRSSHHRYKHHGYRSRSVSPRCHWHCHIHRKHHDRY